MCSAASQPSRAPASSDSPTVSRSPSTRVTPGRSIVAARSRDRTRATTESPRSSNRGTSARPITPVAPTRKILIALLQAPQAHRTAVAR